ncbi:MAG TPA: oligosaccharide flippase family protein [Lapillicoccus sp.]|nr:oligosaccharide flippase family protein [Lapillicoccus sp.]
MSTEAQEGRSASEHMSSIGRKAGRGLRWALFGSVVGKLGSFVMSLVLARLLAPSDFGLYAVALAATQFAMHVNDMGIIAAVVQWRGRIEDMAATAATMALLFSIGWYALFWFAAPAFADLAGSPEATPIVRLLTATILVDGVTAVRVGILQRTFRQDRLSLAIMAGFFVNAVVAITLASRGAGAYSFAIGQLVQSLVTAVIVMLSVRMPLRYGLNRDVARQLLRFGVPLAIGLGAESLLLYSDSVVVGHVLGPALLGFYLLAFNISSWIPGLVGTAVRYVSMPGFSRLAEHDHDTLALGARQVFAVMFTCVVPMAVGLMTLAPALVTLLYGEQWLPSSSPLRFLAVVMVVRLLTGLALDVQTSLGKTRTTVWVNTIWVAALLPALYLGAHLDGITGAAVGHAIIALSVAVPVVVGALHRSGVALRPIVPSLLRALLGGAVAAVVMLVLARAVGESAVLEVLVAGTAGVLAYIVLVVPGPLRRKAIARLRRTPGTTTA